MNWFGEYPKDEVLSDGTPDLISRMVFLTAIEPCQFWGIHAVEGERDIRNFAGTEWLL